MKISIKLKHTQLSALVNLLETTINTEECYTRYEAIVMILMVKFYTELKKKTVMMEPRKYTISVGPETAMAFVVFFLILPVDTSSQAGNLVDSLIAQFDQKTAQYFSLKKIHYVTRTN
jgi:hypothetical protein